MKTVFYVAVKHGFMQFLGMPNFSLCFQSVCQAKLTISRLHPPLSSHCPHTLDSTWSSDEASADGRCRDSRFFRAVNPDSIPVEFYLKLKVDCNPLTYAVKIKLV